MFQNYIVSVGGAQRAVTPVSSACRPELSTSNDRLVALSWPVRRPDGQLFTPLHYSHVSYTSTTNY